MKDLVITSEERRLLTEPVRGEHGVRVFFPHDISSESFQAYKTLWDKILVASEVDGDLVNRVKALLPKQAMDIKEVPQLQLYNCFTAALYALGVKNFDGAMEFYSPETGDLALPFRRISLVGRVGLMQAGFLEVEHLQEQGSRGLVLLENSMGPHLNHAAAYLGSSDGMDLYFHKPLPCLPGIMALETMLEAGAYAQGRRKKAEVTYSFWQLDLPHDTALVEPVSLKIYNPQTSAQAIDSRALVVEGHDLTPIILYHQGKAIAVVQKCLYNMTDVAYSFYMQAPDGTLYEWHEDPSHGDWLRPMEVERTRFEQLDNHNPRTFQLLKILGYNQLEVERHLKELDKFVYHQETPGLPFSDNPRALLPRK